jgi:hypothetical protein
MGGDGEREAGELAPKHKNLTPPMEGRKIFIIWMQQIVLTIFII